ncbi:MAG: matrixin family metalloprotease [Nocardioides sp.]
MRRQITFVALALTAALVPMAHATAGTRAATAATTADASSITATFPSGSLPTGTRAPVTGTVGGSPGRPVLVQAQGSNGSWVTLASGKSGPDGSYAVPAPTWWAAHQTLRVYAPATGLDPAATSPNTGSVTVDRRYQPRAGRQFSYLSGHLIRWNPCAVISYRVNPDHMSRASFRAVKWGFRQLSEATGLQFRYAGRTSFVPFRAGQSTTLFPSNADIAIAWAKPSVVPLIKGSLAGYATANWIRIGEGDPEYTEGRVVFDLTAKLGRTKKQVRNARKVLTLHELGHAVGLGHVRDSRQIMSQDSYPKAEYARGDLRGLKRVGASEGCVPGATRIPLS